MSRMIQVVQSSVKSGVGKSGKPYKALVVKGMLTDAETGEIRMVDDMIFTRGDDPKPLQAGHYEIEIDIFVMDGRLASRISGFKAVAK